MNIFLSSDHRGFKLKEEIKTLWDNPHQLVDLGAAELVPADDYTIFARRVCERIISDRTEGKETVAVLLCGSGIGMAILANKFPGIRASLVSSSEAARVDKEEHDSNILIIAADSCPTAEAAIDIINSWLGARHKSGRHQRRLKNITLLERELAQAAKFGLTTPLRPQIIPAPLTNSVTDLTEQLMIASALSPSVSVDFVDNTLFQGSTLAFGEIVDALQSHKLPVSIHLMTAEPNKYIQQILGIDCVELVYVHAEAELGVILRQELPFRLGLALSPATAVPKELINQFPVILLMTIEPGAQGREFMPEQLKKADEARSLGYAGEIHCDGGVNADTLELVASHGIDVANVGSAFSKAENREQAYQDLVGSVLKLNKPAT